MLAASRQNEREIFALKMMAKSNTLAKVSNERFFAVAHDPETYISKVIKGSDILKTWLEFNYDPPSAADQDELDAFDEIANDLDSWHVDSDGAPCMLEWACAGEGSGMIYFYRINEEGA